MIMKSKVLIALIALKIFFGCHISGAQEVKSFPFDPLVTLKAWNYDKLIKTMGSGEEIISKINNQDYVSGLRYKADLLGIQGTLEYTFTQDSISSFHFRFLHTARVVNADHSDRRTRDRSASRESELAIQKLDSLQKLDSISRDSVIKGITGIMGEPFSNGPTPVTEKTARHSAIWINNGFSCQYKDYVDYSEIAFSLPYVPLWLVGEFSIPNKTQIISKRNIKTKKISCTASLMGFTSSAPRITYADFFLFMEYTRGQKFLVSIPKNPMDYMYNQRWVEFCTRQMFHISIPENSIGYLSSMSFEDCDGDAVPEVWIQVRGDKQGNQSRHLLYSIQFKEPNLIFDTDDLIPTEISFLSSSQILVSWPDGASREITLPKPLNIPSKAQKIHPKGLKYLKTTKLNSDGSANFIGGIELRLSPESPVLGILEITFKHTPGAWETDQIIFVPQNK
jgi:hypothetical protein